jgi:hypothetical protein
MPDRRSDGVNLDGAENLATSQLLSKNDLKENHDIAVVETLCYIAEARIL